MQLKCPACAALFSAEAALDQHAAREVMALLASLDGALGRPLLAYVALFRPRKSALSWDRSLRLLTEALALHPDHAILAQALGETVVSLHTKQVDSSTPWVPLVNHNYLRRVVGSLASAASPAPTSITPRAPAPAAAPSSKVGQALVNLEALKR